MKIWFQNRRTKWKKHENISNAEAAEHRVGGQKHSTEAASAGKQQQGTGAAAPSSCKGSSAKDGPKPCPQDAPPSGVDAAQQTDVKLEERAVTVDVVRMPLEVSGSTVKTEETGSAGGGGGGPLYPPDDRPNPAHSATSASTAGCAPTSAPTTTTTTTSTSPTPGKEGRTAAHPQRDHSPSPCDVTSGYVEVAPSPHAPEDAVLPPTAPSGGREASPLPRYTPPPPDPCCQPDATASDTYVRNKDTYVRHTDTYVRPTDTYVSAYVTTEASPLAGDSPSTLAVAPISVATTHVLATSPSLPDHVHTTFPCAARPAQQSLHTMSDGL